MTVQEITAKIEEIIKERDMWKDQAAYWETMATHHRIERENIMNEYRWKPIETFDRRMFSLMSTGIPDSVEAVKYKGEVPGWAAFWCSVPPHHRPVTSQE